MVGERLKAKEQEREQIKQKTEKGRNINKTIVNKTQQKQFRQVNKQIRWRKT
eukprot:gnl/Chilomastix_caulleri/5769.p2 GENE.gnl/Chilomastix_caulleri/5769~~gnl/Chilomastix_caulleri/5769.p2  ORF type:complete len:52 (+),score=6.19 gnl/Chilomastix_caulleri/5769:103-258(+)